MSQSATWPIPTSSPDPETPVGPDDFANAVLLNFAALLSLHSGASRPAYAVTGTVWLNTATGQILIYDAVADADRIVPVQVAVPATADAAGVVGQYAVESGFVYHCVATDTWERVAIATWS